MTTMLSAIMKLLTGQLAELTVSVVIVASQIVFLWLSGYIAPNIRHILIRRRGSHRSHFLIKNLNSHYYHHTMRIVVRSVELGKIRSIEAQGGPWCNQLVQTSDGDAGKAKDDGRDEFTVAFRGVPEDAVFGLRVVSDNDVEIDFGQNSEIKGERFKKRLESFDNWRRRWLYFGVRFCLGLAGYLLIQISAQHLAGDDPEPFEIWFTAGIGLALAVGIFVLVVPTTGKRTILGYLETRPSTRCVLPELQGQASRADTVHRSGGPLVWPPIPTRKRYRPRFSKVVS